VVEIARQALRYPTTLGESAGLAPALKSPKQSSQQEQASMLTDGMPALDAAHSSADVALIGFRPASVEILVLSGELKNQRFPVEKQLRFGREADNDLTLPDKKVSRHHAVLQRQGAIYQISDLNSGNGTYVNGKRITEPTLLKNGDIMLIGDTKLTISNRA
jgi:pSer/pThr/pTyr-binding forkhead associated (FHA) protein